MSDFLDDVGQIQLVYLTEAGGLVVVFVNVLIADQIEQQGLRGTGQQLLYFLIMQLLLLLIALTDQELLYLSTDVSAQPGNSTYIAFITWNTSFTVSNP